MIKDLGFEWGCNTRVDAVDEKLLYIMKDSGCVYMFCGVESGVPEVLLGMNKTRDPKNYLLSAKHVYKTMSEAGLPSSVFLIFGAAKRVIKDDKPIFIPDDLEDAKKSIEFAISLEPNYLSMNVLRLLPGVPFSCSEKFASIRPNGEIVHGGHYDEKWYESKYLKDLRSKHEIYRAFEGRGSVNPPHMTPEVCYKILEFAVKEVNKAKEKGLNIKIVTDPSFSEKYLEIKDGKYVLAPFEKIDKGC